VILAPAAAIYMKARTERGRRIFSPVELGIFLIVLVGAVVGLLGLIVGFVTI
jgi:arginine:ornithine antiporter/lysine permease